jgi:hypothetical protein
VLKRPLHVTAAAASGAAAAAAAAAALVHFDIWNALAVAFVVACWPLVERRVPT